MFESERRKQHEDVIREGASMNDLIHRATACIARLLSAKLPELSPDWWPKLVLDRLSFHQQRTARERGFKTLQQLDFGASFGSSTRTGMS